MRIGTMLDVKTIKNLEEIKSEKSFEEQYDEGLRRLNFNRQRMNEFKTSENRVSFLFVRNPETGRPVAIKIGL